MNLFSYFVDEFFFNPVSKFDQEFRPCLIDLYLIMYFFSLFY